MKYVTLAQTLSKRFHENAARHLSNAIGYANKGLASHCDGSMRKAMRNFKRAVEIEKFVSEPYGNLRLP